MSSVKPPVSRVTPGEADGRAEGPDGPADRPDGPAERPDGRSARWASHRKARRDELIEAAIIAISRHGASVGMDQIAAVAGTSKPVIYRYFADKQDLYRAVTKRVVGEVLATLTRVTAAGPPPRELMHAGVDACFALLDRHPELFRFVVLHPLIPDDDRGTPTDFATVVANLLSTRLSLQLEAASLDPSLGQPWGEAIVGFVRAAGLWWLDHRDTIPREQLADMVSALLWGGAAGVYQSAGVAGIDARPLPGTFPPLIG